MTATSVLAENVPIRFAADQPVTFREGGVGEARPGVVHTLMSDRVSVVAGKYRVFLDDGSVVYAYWGELTATLAAR